MDSVSLSQEKLGQLAKAIRGKVVLPDNKEEYDRARKLYNLMFDRKPALVVQPAGVSDIIEAVNFARDNNIGLSVKCGGHNSAGRSVLDGALLLDLSSFKGIRVNPSKKTVRVEAGALWEDLDAELQRFNLGTVGGVISSTGVAGLTLGGGWGWLSTQYGLSCDNVLSMDVVTSEGQLITCDDNNHQDLFWALCGGGGNFGVVTSLKFKVYDVSPKVYGGMLIFPFERVKEIVAAHQKIDPTMPAKAVAWPVIAHPPPAFQRVVIVLVFYEGSEVDAKKVLAPYFDLGPVAVNASERTWREQQQSINFLGMPARVFWKAGFVNSVTDEMLDLIISRLDKAPAPQTVMFENYLRNIASIPKERNAFTHRRPAINLFLNCESPDASKDGPVAEWARGLYSELSKYFVGAAMNFEAEDADKVLLDSKGKLQAVKKRYDPNNMFTAHPKWFS